jgi:hypothetical protein
VVDSLVRRKFRTLRGLEHSWRGIRQACAEREEIREVKVARQLLIPRFGLRYETEKEIKHC